MNRINFRIFIYRNIAIFILLFISALLHATETFTPTSTETVTITPTNTVVEDAYSFEVTVPASVIAGNVFYITVTARSISGQTVAGYAGEVDFNSSTLSTLPASYIFQPSDGGLRIFPVQIMGAGDQDITVFDLNTPSVSGFSVLNVLAANTEFFSISAPSAISAGQAFYITVTAKDNFNNPTVLYSGTASFQSTDPISALPPDTVFQRDDNGKKVLAVTLKTKGTQVITADDPLNPLIYGSSNAVAVSNGSISKFVINSPSTANPGTGFNIAVTAQDAYGNIVDNYNGTAHITSSDIGAVLPANYTFLSGDYGNRIFSVTLNNAGTKTISVNDVSVPAINAVSSSIVVNSSFNPYNQPLMLTSYLPQANLYQFIYMRVSAPAATAIPANSYLEYDVFMPAYNADFYTGVDMAGTFSGTVGTNLRDYGQLTQSYIKDQNAIRSHPSTDLSAYANGNWYHRKFDIGVLAQGAGSTYTELNLSQDTGNAGLNGAPSNSAGTFNALYDNITLKDAGGNILKNFFSNSNVIPFTNTVSLDGSVAANRGDGGWPAANRPQNNYIWVIKDMNLSVNPAGSILANGVSSCTITANLYAPGAVPVSYALMDFNSDRAVDVIAPAAVSLNVRAITDGAGNAFAGITSTKAGVANITVRSGNLSKIIAVNFIAGPASKIGISPVWASAETNVQSTIVVRIEDAFGNFVSDGRVVNLTSGSASLKFSSDNGTTWLNSIAVTGSVERDILIIDTVSETVTVQAAAAGISTAASVIYVNNAPAQVLNITPQSSSAKAGTARIFTVQAGDSSGNNTYQSGSIHIASASSAMRFSDDGINYSQALDTAITNGRADIYCVETIVGAYVTVTASSLGLSAGHTYLSTVPNDPAILSGFADKYAVIAGQPVTITAMITDTYGNAVFNKFITFTAQVEGGLGNSSITPSGNSTNSSGQVTVVFTTKSTSAAQNYCIINSTGLLGKTINISGSTTATAYAILPNPVAVGADKTEVLYLNAKDTGGYNAPATAGHNHVFVYVTQPAGTNNVFFSSNGGLNWYNSVTVTLDSSGLALVDVKSHFPGAYILRGMDTNAVTPLTPAGDTLTVSTAYYVSVSPLAAVNAPAGSMVTVSAQIVDQNGTPAALSNKKVDFSVNRGSVSPSTVFTNAGGLATSYITLALGSYLQHFVTASVTNPDAVSVSAAITGLPVISFAVSIPSTASINTSVNALVRVKDAYGETITNYTGTVNFTSSDSLATLPGNYNFSLADSGIKNFSVSFATSNPQAQTITVTDISQPAIKGISNTIIMFLKPTATPTISPTRTITPTRTASPTFTVTPTASPTGTKTSTRTITPTNTPSPTDTATGTRTISPTFTITATITATFTITETSTISKTWTVSPTLTDSPTITETWTDSPTFTETPTFTVTDTDSPTLTVTQTNTDSPTFTQTDTATPTYSATQTNTATFTGTFTPTFTVTFTITQTLTVTITRTATVTYTITPTATYYYKNASPGESYVFPQPAKSTVSIAYSLAVPADVNVYIYNSAGMQVASFNQQGMASDYNRFVVDLDRFSPGVYYYLIRCKTSSGAEIKFKVNKFLVVKIK